MNDEIVARLRADFEPVVDAMRIHAAEIRGLEGLACVRPGYATTGDEKVPALVLAFHPDRQADVASFGERAGVRVATAVASPAEQIRGAFGPSFQSPLLSTVEPIADSFAPARRGTYKPPTGAGAPRLEPVDEPMRVTLSASPDSGWPVLRDFFAEPVRERLTVAMYDFTAPHVASALLGSLADSDARLRMVLDGRPAGNGVGGTGVNAPDLAEFDIVRQLREELGDRFELSRASVGAHGAVPKAYHIKVASADGERMWLSSGNWQSSNLPAFDHFDGEAPPLPIRRYNRDYHVVVRNQTLARCYASFIEYDASSGSDYAGAAEEELTLLVPLGEELAYAPIRRFRRLEVEDRVRVTPLLTPDNFTRYVLEQLSGATTRVWIQNQYIHPRGGGDDFPELLELVAQLGELATRVDLRLCLRGAPQDDRDFLLAAGVRPSQMRTQGNCHAKLIVIDDRLVIVGSQNLSNEGFVANRDASLAFEHPDIVDYFATFFGEDWSHASPVSDATYGVRVATDATTPAGFERLPWSAVFDYPPPAAPQTVTPPAGPVDPVAPKRAPKDESTLEVPFFGVHEDGRRDSARVDEVAAAIRKGSAWDPARAQLGLMAKTGSFALPPGASADELSDVGWGVVWGPGTTPEVKAALRPLLEHRRAEIDDDLLLHELTLSPGEDVRAFLQRNGADFGSVRPRSVPLHLLLVGDPESIPFSFQSLLDVEYRVGRLDLADVAAYERYARSVVEVETGTRGPRDRVLRAFGPEHEGDQPTALSAKVLVRDAVRWFDEVPKLRKKLGLDVQVDAGDDATKARLVELLRGTAGRPELLFTAGHGLQIDAGSPRLYAEQGALVTADWNGFDRIDSACRLAAEDIPDDADLLGMVLFLFACFGVGTPETDSFPTRAGVPLAPRAFVSALPRALLAHRNGAALGVFGHVDRTLVWSLQPPGAGVATVPFARAAVRVLAGSRLGGALEDLNGRGASLASSVSAALQPGTPPVGDMDLVSTWTQQRDASAFLLFGDPAARLPR